MTSKTRKRLIRAILIPIVSLLVLVCIAIVVLFSQQRRLVELGVSTLNQRLPGELMVGGSEISVFQNFPYISIALNKVRLYATKDTAVRPILEAERLYTGFSLPDILRQKYNVKVIALKNGHLDLVQDQEGRLNVAEATRFSGDTTTPKTNSSGQMDLDIKKFVLKNLDVSFLDKCGNQQVNSHIDRIQAAFRDDSLQLDADLQGTMLVDYTRPGDTTLFRHKHLETDIRLSYVKATKVLKLPVGKLQLDKAVFNITGTADLHDNMVEFRFSGDKPDFRQLFAFAPPSMASELKHFKYDGQLTFEGIIKGQIKTGQQPLIELKFSCSNAWLHNTLANKKLDSLAFKGYYTNGAEHNLKTSELRLLDMRARPGEGVFRGNFVLRDFTDPKMLMQINSELELGFVGAFLGIKDLQRITGHISLKMDLRELVDLNLPEQSMSKLAEGVQSELTVSNLTFRIPAYPYLVEHLNAHARMKAGFVQLDTLSFIIGNSDFHLAGSLSDLPALFHHQQKPVLLTLNARSNKIVLKELLAADSARDRKAKEEIYGFNVGLSLETSVDELLHPHPLPKGRFIVDSLCSAFKLYPHAFRDFGAQLMINDTTLLLKNFAGRIDSSDIRFSGRVNNYALWFAKTMKGKTQIAFDLKSQRLAMNDLLGRISRTYLPKDYQHEVGSNIWLRSKIDLRYDSVFQFANIKIAHISGSLQQHAYQLDSISGNVKFGTDNFIKIDTLKGKIGRSDFAISMRLYEGKDTIRRKKENFLQFSSRFLDVDQLTNYYLTAEESDSTAPVAIDAQFASAPLPNDPQPADTLVSANAQLLIPSPAGPTTSLAVSTLAAAKPSSLPIAKPSSHTDAFNIFRIPFIDFNAAINIGKIRYHHLGLKNFSAIARMQANQQLYLDTFGIEIAGGKITASGQFNGTDPQKIYLRSRICMEDVNIEKLMLKLDYLGQDYVINKNIRGSLSGQIESYVQVHPDLTPLVGNSEATVDLEILNGALVNFAPIHAMSSYFKDKNLNMVRFDTLRNSLTFKNGTLSIPDMNINSSLGYMEISGQQSMDERMEYYLRIPLKMVTQAGFHMLFGKKQEEVDPDQVDAIEYRDKERKIRFMNLRIAGTPDDYKVSLGKAKKS